MFLAPLGKKPTKLLHFLLVNLKLPSLLNSNVFSLRTVFVDALSMHFVSFGNAHLFIPFASNRRQIRLECACGRVCVCELLIFGRCWMHSPLDIIKVIHKIGLCELFDTEFSVLISFALSDVVHRYSLEVQMRVLFHRVWLPIVICIECRA